jgi:hypothetical protein
MRLQPLTCHKSTKSHGGACLEATHVPPLQQAHNAIVVTAASRYAQLVGMTVCMFGLNEAATIPCRAHHTASQILGHPPSGPQVEILTGGKKQSVPADGSPMYSPHETSNPPLACWQHHYQDICGEHPGAVREPQRHVIGSRLERSYAVQPPSRFRLCGSLQW